jgi:hypothetical protein
MEAYKSNAASENRAALSTRLAELSASSQRLTCKVAKSYGERDAIFKLRYQSYLRAQVISQNPFRRYIEAADHASNAYLIGLYLDGKLVSSLRVQVGSSITPNIASLELFPQLVGPLLGSNNTLVEMNCVTTDTGISGPYIWLPYLTLRPWILAAEHFNADYIVAIIRPQYRPFYQRVLGCELHADLRQPPHRLGSVALATLDFVTSAKRLYENLPFLRSTPFERQRLFEHDTPVSQAFELRPSAK